MKRMTKYSYLLVILITAIMLSSCKAKNKEVDVTISTTNEVDVVSTSQQEVDDDNIEQVINDAGWDMVDLQFVYTHGSGKDFTLKAVENQEILYLDSNDFIDLCNIINKNYKYIENISYEAFNKETMEIQIVYSNKTNSMNQFIGGYISSSSLYLENVDFIGTTLEKSIKLNEEIIKPLRVLDKVYIPIDMINFSIFTGQPYILRMDRYKYDMALSVVDNQTDLCSNYILSLELFNKYLKDNYKNYESINIPDDINNYMDYYLFVVQMLLSLNDYHVQMFSPAPEGIDLDIANEMYKNYEWVKYFTSLPPAKEYASEPKWLNSSNIYIPFNTFNSDEEFKKLDEMLSDDSFDKYKELDVIIDLRDNGGGDLINIFKLIRRFTSESFDFDIAKIINSTIFGEVKYTIKSFTDITRSYNFIILVNEKSASASLLATSLFTSNYPTVVFGREPAYKQSRNKGFFQLIDGTIITLSRSDYTFLHNNQMLDDVTLVDQIMTDEEIEDYIDKLTSN